MKNQETKQINYPVYFKTGEHIKVAVLDKKKDVHVTGWSISQNNIGAEYYIEQGYLPSTKHEFDNAYKATLLKIKTSLKGVHDFVQILDNIISLTLQDCTEVKIKNHEFEDWLAENNITGKQEFHDEVEFIEAKDCYTNELLTEYLFTII